MAQNLRDRGYSSSMEYRPNRSDKKNAVMDKNTSDKSVVKAVSTENKWKEPDPTLTDKLVKAYTQRFFGTKMPRVHNVNWNNGEPGTPDSYSERGYALRDYKNNRYGTASSTYGWDENGNPYSRYEANIDNGNPGRGNLDVNLRTPLADINGGFDQEVNYASIQNPTGDYGANLYFADDRFAYPLEASIGSGVSDVTGGNMYYADTNYPFTEDRYKSFNTPLGDLSLFTSAKSPFNDGYGSIDFTPNQYAQALINLLRGR